MKYIIRKNLLLMKILVLIPFSSTYAWDELHSMYAIGGLVAVATVTTLYAGVEHMQKKSVTEQFHRSEERARTLQKKLYEYEQGLIQQARNEELLGLTEIIINEMEARYKDVMHYDINTRSLVDGLAYVLVLVHGHNDSYTDAVNMVKERINGLSMYISQLELKCNDPQYKDTIAEQANECIKKLTPLLKNTRALQSFLEKHKSYIPLMICYLQLENTYQKEIVLARAYTDEVHFMEGIDAHIRSIYAQVNNYFPYLSYVERIINDNKALSTILHELQGYHMEAFQQEQVTHAYEMKKFLEDIIQRVVASPLYVQEKMNKPEFDRADQRLQAELYEKQERLKAELREKQARIEHEKHLTELALQKERNREQELAMQYAHAERERKAFEVKEKELEVELARIKDQENIKYAIAQVNQEWQAQVVNLRNKIEQYEKSVNQMMHELDKSHNAHQADLKRYHNKLHKITQQIHILKSQLNQVPCNPESVEGLENYLDGLLARIMGIEELLSS